MTAAADGRSIRADRVVLPSSLPTTRASAKPQVSLPGRIFGTHKFLGGFDHVFRADGTTIIRTPPYTPVVNAYAERWVGTVRRELCDRTLIWNHRQLEQLLDEYVEHYNTHRPHRSLGQRAPNNAAVIEYRPGRPIRRHSTCSGLINEYRQTA